MKRIVKFSSALVVGAALAGWVAAPASAHGWGGGGWHGGGWGGRGWGGVGFGFAVGALTFYAPSPYYYAPPVYYAVPPAYPAPPAPYYYYAPYGTAPAAPPAQPAVPQSSSASAAESCNAGSYVCPMETAASAGARCYCPGNDGNRVYGSAQ